jgi:hypothetical protein
LGSERQILTVILRQYCTEEMETKLKNEGDINTKLMDPLELLLRIEKFMKESQDGRYDMWHGWEQQRKLFNLRQGKDESLLDYKERFDRQAELQKEKMGDDWFNQFVTSTQDYRDLEGHATAQAELLKGSYSLMCATGFLCNSDRTRTEDLIKDLRENYSRNLDQYPKNMEDSVNMLSVHLSSKPLKNKAEKGLSLYQNKQQGKGKTKPACYVCGKEDCRAPRCARRWDPKEKWASPDHYKQYPMEQGANMAQVGNANLPLQMVAPPQVVAPQIFQVTSAPQQAGEQIPAGTQMVQIATDRGPMMVPVYQPQGQGVQMVQTSASAATEPTSNTRAARPFVRARGYSQFCIQIEKKRTLNRVISQMRVTLLTMSDREAWNINEQDSFQRMVELDEQSEMFREQGYESGMSDATPTSLAENEYLVGMQEFRNARARREELALDPFGLYWTSLLDSGASHSTWCNDGIVHGIYEAPYPMHMFTNTGDRVINEMGFVDAHPYPIYYDREGSANVNSMSELVQHGYRITMDTDVDNAMIVHCGGDRQMRFVMKKGVYVFENPDGPRERGADETSLRARNNQPLNVISQPYFSAYQKTGYSADQVMMPTVRKNMEGFTRKQVQAAQDVRSAMHIMGAPDERRLKQAIRAGLFKNCTITEEAIDHAQAIYGKDTSTLKGKSTRKTPKKVIDDWIAIPRELTEHNELLELHIDHMFVNNAIFLTCIDGTVKFRMCKAVPNTSASEMLTGLDTFLRTYNHGGFDIVKINCDQAFIPITEEMQDEMNIVVDPTTPGGHEPTAERNNRTIKERMRVAHARMPYSAIPRVMTEALGERVAETLNYFPAKNGISDHYSTMQIVEHRNVDFKRDCVAEFGAYVHGKGGESKNTMVPRTIEAVYLRPTKLLRAGHKLLNLNSRKVITRPQVVVLPATDQVIAKVNLWANEEGVYSLKFFDKNGDEETFQDGDQIAGVDDTQQGYAEEAFDPDYQDEEENELNRDATLQGTFDDIDYDEEVDLIMEAIDEVYDDDEVAELFGDDDDDVPALRYRAEDADEDDDDSDDEDFDFEPPIGQTVPEVAIEEDGDQL